MAPTLTGLVERVAQWVLPPAPLPPEILAASPIDLTDLGSGWEEPPPLTEGAMTYVDVPPEFEPAPLSLTAAPTGQRSLRPAPASRPAMLPLSQQAPVQTSWSAKAWAYYRSSGEARQAVDWVAGGISRFRLFVGTGVNDGSGDPEPMDDPGVAGEVLAELFDGPMGQQEALKKLAVNLLVPGEAWMVGYPKAADPFDTDSGIQMPTLRPVEPTRPARWGGSWADFGEPDTARPVDQQGGPGSWQADRGTVEGETSWAVVTRREWQEMDSGRLRLKLPDDPRRTADHWVEFEPGDVVIVPVYQPDPEDASRATSAFEAAMAIFEELDGLNRRVGADINSRLAGAGVAVVSENATMPAPGPEQGAGVNPLRPRGFLASLLTAISTAISNPDSASAVAPIVLQVPDEAFQGEGPIKHVTFATPFDAQVPVLREDARRRVAVVMDIPASIVNGIEDLNHWSAWAVSDDAIRSHLGPLASLICSTITRKILWPVLRAAGVEDWRRYVIWWDASELVLRPDRSTEALAAHSQGAISDRALRRTLAFDEEDAPDADELARRQVEAARQRVTGASPAGGPQGGQAGPGNRPEPPNQQQSDARMNRAYEAGPPVEHRPNPAPPPAVAASATRVA